jgi:hypothetical protein
MSGCVRSRIRSAGRAVPTIVPVTRQNSASRANGSQVARSWKSLKRLDLLEKSKMPERRIPFSKPPYAALWKSSICRIQLVSGFHLVKIWATNSKSLILNG